MRKFLIRCWYLPNWEQLAFMRMVMRWNGAEPSWTVEEYRRLIVGAPVSIEREDESA